MNEYLNNLNWRYATKKFDSTKKISNENLEILLEAAQLSASSYGLQPYKFYVVSDDETKKKLRKAGYDQPQITDASQVIIFASMTDFGDELVDDYIELTSEVRSISKEDLTGYAQIMKSSLVGLPQEQKAIWAAKQSYIALGNLLSAAAAMNIDACPMEGFDAKQFNEILGLSNKKLNASVIMTVGYRSNDDETQHYEKVRKSINTLVKHF